MRLGPARRPGNIVDRWDDDTYRRLIVLDGRPVELAVRQMGTPATPILAVTLQGPRLPPHAPSCAKALLDRTFGLRIDVAPFRRIAARDPRLRPLARRFRGLRPPRFPTLFEALGNGIACQQITLTVGIELLNRLARACGRSLAIAGETRYAFPRPADVLDLSMGDLRGLGFSGHKARALLGLSRSIVGRSLDVDALETMDDDAVRGRLLELDGVGRWTADYVLLRGLGRVSVFPADDVGARNRLGQWLHRRTPLDSDGVRTAVRAWQPWSGFVYFHMLLQGLLERGRLDA